MEREDGLYLLRFGSNGLSLVTGGAQIGLNRMAGAQGTEVVEQGESIAELLKRLQSGDINRTWYVVIDWMDSDGRYRHMSMEPELMPLCRIPKSGLLIRLNRMGDVYRVAYPISLWQRVSVFEMRHVIGFEDAALREVGEWLKARMKEDDE